MPCFTPNNVRYYVDEFGKKRIQFRSPDNRIFYEEDRFPKLDLNGSSSYDCRQGKVLYPMQIQCNQCIGCRLENSRQKAVRAVHEASLYEDNSFVTLTFNDKSLVRMCPNGSLQRRHMQLFMKKLRKKFERGVKVKRDDGSFYVYKANNIRFMMCGEYGDMKLTFRPHYHILLFNVNFPDKTYWKTVNKHHYYRSRILEKLWKYGYSTIGEVTFESAAYVARYCLKKVNGKAAEDHYTRVDPETGEVVKLLPEFYQASNKPGIGKPWFDKYGMTDVFPRDEVVMRGKICRPPRYYVKLLERIDPEMYKVVKAKRMAKMSDNKEDNVYSRLKVKLRLQEIRLGLLVRTLEAQA